jgi:hypothetical protein
MTRPRVAALAILLVTSLATGALLASGWARTLPSAAASAVLARISTTDDQATGCLERLERPGGWLDLCWMITRQSGADGDYYLLRLVGTLNGEAGGVRWAALRARLVDTAPADEVFFGWPAGSVEGACEVRQVGRMEGGGQEEVCGLTSGAFVGAWDYRVDWRCVGCLLPDRSARPVVLRFAVKVPAGAVPGWEVGADFGS